MTKGAWKPEGRASGSSYLTPVPRGDSLAEISAAVLREVDAAWRERVQRDGRRCWDLWQEENCKLLALPERPFEARRVVLAPISGKATVHVDKAIYSVSSRWPMIQPGIQLGEVDRWVLSPTSTS